MRNCNMGPMPMYPMQPMPNMNYNNEMSLKEQLNNLENRVSRLENMIQMPHNESNNFYMV